MHYGNGRLLLTGSVRFCVAHCAAFGVARNEGIAALFSQGGASREGVDLTVSGRTIHSQIALLGLVIGQNRVALRGARSVLCLDKLLAGRGHGKRNTVGQTHEIQSN